MRNTLENINTLVREVLHELGLARVRKQVEKKDFHVLKAVTKFSNSPFSAARNSETTIVTVETWVRNVDDGKKVKPMVTFSYSQKKVYKSARFTHEQYGSVIFSPSFVFVNKEKLLRSVREWLEQQHLRLGYSR